MKIYHTVCLVLVLTACVRARSRSSQHVQQIIVRFAPGIKPDDLGSKEEENSSEQGHAGDREKEMSIVGVERASQKSTGVSDQPADSRNVSDNGHDGEIVQPFPDRHVPMPKDRGESSMDVTPRSLINTSLETASMGKELDTAVRSISKAGASSVADAGGSLLQPHDSSQRGSLRHGSGDRNAAPPAEVQDQQSLLWQKEQVVAESVRGALGSPVIGMESVNNSDPAWSGGQHVGNPEPSEHQDLPHLVIPQQHDTGHSVTANDLVRMNDLEVSEMVKKNENNVSKPVKINEQDFSDPVKTNGNDVLNSVKSNGNDVNGLGAVSASNLKPTSKSSHLSPQNIDTTMKQAHLATEDSDTADDLEAEEDDLNMDVKDDCEISRLPCSPFFSSPCDNNRANGPEYGGHCSISREKAKKQWKTCGGWTPGNKTACFCNKNAAVCCANLTAIPDFRVDHNQTILYLNFTSNNLTVLHKGLFKNLTQLKWLILSRNNFSVVRTDSLTSLKKLQRFEFAYNQFSTKINPQDFLAAVNKVTSLQVLDVNYTVFSYAKPMETGITWIIRHLKLPKLRQLFVDGGSKTAFYLSDLDPARLPRLCQFSIKSQNVQKFYCCSVKSVNDSLQYNDEEEVQDMSQEPYWESCISPESMQEPYCQNFSLPNLKLLNLANNSQVFIPQFCRRAPDGGRVSVAPNLTHLMLAINAIINPRRYQFQCLDNLLLLELTGNPLKKIESNIFQNMGQLQVVDLRFTNVMQIDPSAFNHSSLRVFTIRSSNWFIDQHHDACCISPHLFEGISSNIEDVDLSYNVFRFADTLTIEQFLTPLRHVKVLKMAEIGLDVIPETIIQNFTELEELVFAGNMMSEIPKNVFRNLKQLKSVDLSDNHLAFPREEVFHDLIVTNHVDVNLESNPFSCTCDMLAFLELFKAHYRFRNDSQPPDISNGSVIRKGQFKGESYYCHAPDKLYKTSLQQVPLTIHTCLLTLTQEIIIHVVCLLSIFCILTYMLLYRYRWQVRFWLYTLHVRLTRPQNQEGPRPVCRPRFNAFVSYSKEDSHFVINKVLPALESNSLPLCIHERDFVPGRYFSQNVVERMEESKHVLLVLSNAFLQNDWCRFELFVAEKYGLIHRRIPITILVLEQLRVEFMDAHVITMLQAVPGIQWPGNQGDPQDEANFWQHLGQTLGAVSRTGRGPGRVRGLRGGGGGPPRVGHHVRARCGEDSHDSGGRVRGDGSSGYVPPQYRTHKKVRCADDGGHGCGRGGGSVEEESERCEDGTTIVGVREAVCQLGDVLEDNP